MLKPLNSVIDLLWSLQLHSKKRATCCNIVANRIEELFSVVKMFSIVTPTPAQQYFFILLTTVNNVGSKTFFNPVYSSLCMHKKRSVKKWLDLCLRLNLGIIDNILGVRCQLGRESCSFPLSRFVSVFICL